MAPKPGLKPKIFVAYPYAFSKNDYRGAYKKVAQKYNVEFTYADAKITNRHILEKIIDMISEAEFSVFDVTQWNANVALELGIAMGREFDYYIVFDPTDGHGAPPSDLGGIDRIQYTDYASLTDGLGNLMRQQFGPQTRAELPRPSDPTTSSSSSTN